MLASRPDLGSGAVGRSDPQTQVAELVQSELDPTSRAGAIVATCLVALASTWVGSEQQPHFAAAPHVEPSAIRIEQADAACPSHELATITPRVRQTSRR